MLDHPVLRSELPAGQQAGLRWPRVGVQPQLYAAGMAFSLLLGRALRLPRGLRSVRSLATHPKDAGPLPVA